MIFLIIFWITFVKGLNNYQIKKSEIGLKSNIHIKGQPKI